MISPDDSELHETKMKWISILVLLVVSFGVYANTLSNGFVYDDQFQVVENPWIKDFDSIPEIFSTDVWGFTPLSRSNYYRPVMHLIFMAGYHLFGLNPVGFHLINIIFHAGVVISVFFLALVFFPGRIRLSFLVALIFAVHPVHTEAVAWISGVTELSYTLFLLLALLFYIKAAGVKPGLYVLSIVFFILAALSKEQALSLPFFLIAYDVLFRQDSFQRILKRSLPFVGLIAVYFLIRMQTVGGVAPFNKHAELSVFQYVLNAFPLFAEYLVMLVLPIGLNAFHVLHPAVSLFAPKVLGSLLVVVVFLAGIAISWKKDRILCFGMLLIAVPLLPALYIPALGINAFTERYLYLPSVGFVLLCGVLLAQLEARGLAKAATAAVVVIALLFAAETVNRNKVWRDDFTLWSDTVRKSPDAAMPHYNLGLEYKKRGQLKQAIEQFETAVRLVPEYAKAHANLGAAYLEIGATDKAIDQLLIALKLAPDMTSVRANLGSAYLRKGMAKKAIPYLQSTLAANPDDPKTLITLAVAYTAEGQFTEALKNGRKAIQLEPNSANMHYNLAFICLEAGLPAEAIEHFEKVIKLEPPTAKVLEDIAKAYEMIGNKEAAGMYRDKAAALRNRNRSAPN